MTWRWYARAFLVSLRLYSKQQTTDFFMLFVIFVQPLIYALLVIYMLGTADSHRTVAFATIGGALMSMWVSAIYRSTTAVDSERNSGTLELLVGSPLPLIISMGASITASVFFAGTSLGVTYIVAIMATGTTISVSHPVALAISLILGVAGFVVVGVWFAFATILHPEVRAIVGGLEIIGYIVGSFVVPIEALPIWVRPISYLFLPYWIGAALRNSILASTQWPLGNILATICILSGVYLVGSLFTLQGFLLRARREGSLRAV